jgi:lipid A 3-O-deacylase
MRKKVMTAVCLLALAGAGAESHAVDGVAVSIGNANVVRTNDANTARLAFTWNWQKKWFTGADWQLGGYWEASLGVWRGDSPRGGNRDIVDVGIVPVLRFEPRSVTGAPYFEGGLGVHLQSARRVHVEKDMGSLYQFGSHIGVGFRFGPKGQYDLGYRILHFSNAGIKRPNPGIDFQLIRFQYHF